MPSFPWPEPGRPAEPGAATSGRLVAEFMAWLRDRLGDGTVEEWTGTVPSAIDTTQLHHLPPPRETPADDQRLTRWREAFRPGLCFYRVGPGFLEVRDLRVAAEAVRLIIDDQRLISAFEHVMTPTLTADLSPDQGARADVLLAERLLLRIGDYILAAPCRMRRWPISANRV